MSRAHWLGSIARSEIPQPDDSLEGLFYSSHMIKDPTDSLSVRTACLVFDTSLAAFGLGFPSL